MNKEEISFTHDKLEGISQWLQGMQYAFRTDLNEWHIIEHHVQTICELLNSISLEHYDKPRTEKQELSDIIVLRKLKIYLEERRPWLGHDDSERVYTFIENLDKVIEFA